MMYRSDRRKVVNSAVLFVLSFLLIVASVSTVWSFMYISRLQDKLETAGIAYRALRHDLREEKEAKRQAEAALAILKARLQKKDGGLKDAENVANDGMKPVRRTPVPGPEPIAQPSVIYSNPPVRYGSTAYFRGKCLSCY